MIENSNGSNANSSILDLRGLAAETLTVIDYTGRHWLIEDDLPLRAAVVLLKHADSFESGQVTADVFDASVDAIYQILRRRQPDISRDEVIDAFTVTEMLRLVFFLSSRGQQMREATLAAAEAMAAGSPPLPIPTGTSHAQVSAQHQNQGLPHRTPTSRRSSSRRVGAS